MTDQPKPGKLKRVLKGIFIFIKWVFVLLLALLFIAGLYFQAPWKVLVLIAIFLCAITILPKRFRKYFWLSTVCAIIALATWVFLPEDNTGWKQYDGQKEIAALNKKYKIPDDQNAAVVYGKILDLYETDKHLTPGQAIAEMDKTAEPNGIELLIILLAGKIVEGTFYPDFWDEDLDSLTRDEFWSTADYPEISDWLISKHGPTIKLLNEAAEYERCYLLLESNGVFPPFDEIISNIKHWCKLLMRSANNDAADGRLTEAIEKYACALKMAGHMHQQPQTLYPLVGTAMKVLVHQRIRALVINYELSQAQLDSVRELLSICSFDWYASWPDVLEKVKLDFKRNMLSEYEVNDKSMSRFSREPNIMIQDMLLYFDHEPENIYLDRRVRKALCILAWFWKPSNIQYADSIIDEEFEHYYSMTKADWQKEPKPFSYLDIKLNYRYYIKLFSSFSDHADRKCYRMHLLADSSVQSTRLVIAIKDYHSKASRWPETLNELSVPADLLLDPINNDSFIYKLTEDSFALYSKGENKIDENGDRNRKNEDGTRTDDQLFWPPKNRLNKEESASQ